MCTEHKTLTTYFTLSGHPLKYYHGTETDKCQFTDSSFIKNDFEVKTLVPGLFRLKQTGQPIHMAWLTSRKVLIIELWSWFDEFVKTVHV